MVLDRKETRGRGLDLGFCAWFFIIYGTPEEISSVPRASFVQPVSSPLTASSKGKNRELLPFSVVFHSYFQASYAFSVAPSASYQEATG